MKCHMKFLILLTLACIEIKSERILMILSVPAYGPFKSLNELGKALARKGHDVTFLATFGGDEDVSNYTVKLITSAKFVTPASGAKSLFDYLPMSTMSFLNFLSDSGLRMSETFFENAKLSEMKDSGEEYDLVIVHELNSYSLQGICHYFDAYCVLFTSMRSPSLTYMQVANPRPLSYVPDFWNSFSKRPTFIERLINTISYLYTTGLLFLSWLPKHETILQKYLPGSPSINEIIYNNSLLLVNSQICVSDPHPYVPAVINVGGMHIRPTKALKENLQSFLDSAENGAIVFSLGWLFNPAEIPEDKLKIIFNVLGQLKQKVVMRYKSDNIPENVPENVKLVQWMAQQDVLSHKNVKLLISNAGINSVTESIYHGKPVLAMPMMGDQITNSKTLEKYGLGETLNFFKLTEESFKEAIENILNTPSYTEKAERCGNMMKDEPVKPMQEAIFWVEHVLQHNGGKHLRVAALNLKWYQNWLLDVIAFILGISLLCCIPGIVFIILFIRRRKSKLDINKKLL